MENPCYVIIFLVGNCAPPQFSLCDAFWPSFWSIGAQYKIFMEITQDYLCFQNIFWAPTSVNQYEIYSEYDLAYSTLHR